MVSLSEIHVNYVLFISALLREEPLPKEAKDHSLKGNYQEYREFHISGDLLVIYYIGLYQTIPRYDKRI